MRTVYIVGAGTGSAPMLTREAEQIIRTCPTVIATQRIADGLREIRGDIRAVSYSKTLETVRNTSGDAAILVSGDTGFYSAAASLATAIEGDADVRFIAGIGSLQYFCAALKTRWDDAELISLHGRDGAVVGAVSYSPRVLALTGGDNDFASVCARLARVGLGSVRVTIGENLGASDERIISATAAELADAATEAAAKVAVMLIENDAAVNSSFPLRDSDFIRGDTPMTKEEIRWIAASKMRISRRDTVLDIGAGTGSCSMEFARRADRGCVFAIERNAAARELIAQNRVATGAFNVEIVAGEAPDGLDDLPVPDCVFIGGSGGNIREILTRLAAENPALRVVITAVTLETLHEATTALQALDFAPEITQISAARTQRIGKYNMLTGQNPVFIISGGGNE